MEESKRQSVRILQLDNFTKGALGLIALGIWVLVFQGIGGAPFSGGPVRGIKKSALKSAEQQFREGMSLVGRNEIDAGINQLRKAVELNPFHSQAYFNLGVAYGIKGKEAEATEAFKKVIEIDPGYAPAHNNLGALYARAGKLNEAINEYKEALTLAPNYADAYGNLGAVLARQGALEPAIEALKIAIKLNPNHLGARTSLAEVYTRKGMKAQAAEELKIVQRLRSQAAGGAPRR